MRLHILFFAGLMAACNRGTGDRPAATTRDSAAVAPPVMQADSAMVGRVVLSAEAERTAGIAIAAARAEQAAAVAGWLTVPGQIEADPARVSLISPRVGGRLERLDAVVGQRVTAGQVVAQLYSPAWMTAQGDYQLALERAEALGHTADSTGARALAAAAKRRLIMAGATEAGRGRGSRAENRRIRSCPSARPRAGASSSRVRWRGRPWNPVPCSSAWSTCRKWTWSPMSPNGNCSTCASGSAPA